MELTVGPSREPGVEELEVEIVERKGLGHPDTICDGLAEEFSIALSRFYLDHFGKLLHHNVDKVLLRGGAARPAFGGGEVLLPIEIYLAGRATSQARGVEVPIEDLAVEASRVWFRRTFHALDPDRHVRFHCLTRPGSRDLVGLFARARMANDTSIGVGFAPMSELEKAVAAVASRLSAHELRRACPEVGEDIKIMGIRRGRRIGLTIACAFLGGALRDIADYLDKKERLRRAALEAAASVTDMDVAVEVNVADDPAGGEAGAYITVTGTSAEAGDDGEAGRGNRANGLITPYRPMTLEASAGKNPVTHVGKLYQIAAGRIAQSVSEIPDVAAAECYLASRIGQPVADPQIADVKVRLRDGRGVADIAPEVERIVRRHLDALENVWREFLEGKIGVY
ncbi:MAG: methionine adenosyltransferase [Acidobacteriota bacterium]